ncbi:GH25 family lysozyme [Nocardioides dubius]|uniref:Lysozyme n=1 Tax=Nocardioides dubius TaxID=317019 RepID=A0ABP4EG39_9ACTN
MRNRNPRVGQSAPRQRRARHLGATRLTASAIAALLALTALAGCGDDDQAASGHDHQLTRSEMMASESPRATLDAEAGVPSAEATPSRPRSATSAEEPSSTRVRELLGIDASHHQGPIDWKKVAGDDIEFAYLKASEGSSFTDPRFADNRRQAQAAGLRVGGYHYFSICSPGAPQAAHFITVLGEQGDRRTTLPPAVDLELGGNCAQPPARADLLREVKVFIDDVERATERDVVVYAYPDFEERYHLTAALDRRLWVRLLGEQEPGTDWWLWQKSDSARVDGVSGNVDLNLLRE